MKRYVKWDPEIDSEEDLWVCQICGAELNADCVGDTCPYCDAPIEDQEESCEKKNTAT